MQSSETYRLSALVSFSGGLQDAYTYNLRGHVFANAQTGNVVLMSQNFMTGRWMEGSDYLLPVFSFMAGILLSDLIEGRFKFCRTVHWRQIVLFIEILLLFIVGLIPLPYEMLPNILVSFSCAMQVHSFRSVHANRYASTMCIGNLKSGTESMTRFFRTKDNSDLHSALGLYGIILIFALGAGLGGILSGILGIRTIWLSCAILFIAEILMIKRPVEGDQ